MILVSSLEPTIQERVLDEASKEMQICTLRQHQRISGAVSSKANLEQYLD